ncbi:hypothetical protein JL720_633 [Aureococcus anophagefferens]|nr:hypothetical protein JL720_633 [Aureococcus anophagefferens]
MAVALAARYGSLDDAALTERWADDGETLDVSRALHRCSGAARNALWASPSLARIKVVRAAGAGLDDGDAARLCAALMDNAALETLDLRGNRIGDAGGDAVARLLARSPCRLETLVLSWNRLTAKSAGHVARVVADRPASCRALRRLGLAGCGVDDGVLGARARADAARGARGDACAALGVERVERGAPASTSRPHGPGAVFGAAPAPDVAVDDDTGSDDDGDDDAATAASSKRPALPSWLARDRAMLYYDAVARCAGYQRAMGRSVGGGALDAQVRDAARDVAAAARGALKAAKDAAAGDDDLFSLKAGALRSEAHVFAEGADALEARLVGTLGQRAGVAQRDAADLRAALAACDGRDAALPRFARARKALDAYDVLRAARLAYESVGTSDAARCRCFLVLARVAAADGRAVSEVDYDAADDAHRPTWLRDAWFADAPPRGGDGLRDRAVKQAKRQLDVLRARRVAKRLEQALKGWPDLALDLASDAGVAGARAAVRDAAKRAALEAAWKDAKRLARRRSPLVAAAVPGGLVRGAAALLDAVDAAADAVDVEDALRTYDVDACGDCVAVVDETHALNGAPYAARGEDAVCCDGEAEALLWKAGEAERRGDDFSYFADGAPLVWTRARTRWLYAKSTRAKRLAAFAAAAASNDDDGGFDAALDVCVLAAASPHVADAAVSRLAAALGCFLLEDDLADRVRSKLWLLLLSILRLSRAPNPRAAALLATAVAAEREKGPCAAEAAACERTARALTDALDGVTTATAPRSAFHQVLLRKTLEKGRVTLRCRRHAVEGASEGVSVDAAAFLSGARLTERLLPGGSRVEFGLFVAPDVRPDDVDDMELSWHVASEGDALRTALLSLGGASSRAFVLRRVVPLPASALLSPPVLAARGDENFWLDWVAPAGALPDDAPSVADAFRSERERVKSQAYELPRNCRDYAAALLFCADHADVLADDGLDADAFLAHHGELSAVYNVLATAPELGVSREAEAPCFLRLCREGLFLEKKDGRFQSGRWLLHAPLDTLALRLDGAGHWRLRADGPEPGDAGDAAAWDLRFEAGRHAGASAAHMPVAVSLAKREDEAKVEAKVEAKPPPPPEREKEEPEEVVAKDDDDDDDEPEIAPLKETPFDSAVVGVPHAASGLGFDVPLFHGRRRRRY